MNEVSKSTKAALASHAPQAIEDKQKNSFINEHMANERTFLAWIRTSIGIMAFGFVVEKFALFIKQITLILGKNQLPALHHSTNFLQGHSSAISVFLVAIGVLVCLLSFIQYKKVEKQIEEESYNPSILLNVMLTLSVVLIGFFLMLYLNSSI